MKRLWFGLLYVLAVNVWCGEPSPTDPAGKELGRLKLRTAQEITASNWSVGAETMDRDYTIYRNWREQLGPLGAKKARIQSGWAKTEQRQGRYDWAWLDEIIPDMVAQGVAPWMCLGYGNPLYEQGGNPSSKSPLPASAEALAAWDAFVKALVERYARQINEWEIWNEPNHTGIAAADYARFLIQTATVIRGVQPQAKILALAIAGTNPAYPVEVLGILKEQGQLGLVDQVTFHPYTYNPDDSYQAVARLRQAVTRVAPGVVIRQGENGAPSEKSTAALGKLPWTETMQAKWTLRRMLGDLGHNLECSIFSIMDMHYDNGVNRKGLLKSDGKRGVERPKLAYHAFRHVAAVFDDSLKRMAKFTGEAATERKLAVSGYQDQAGAQVVALWLADKPPADGVRKEIITLRLPAGKFTDPVRVDLISGLVYDLPDDRWRQQDDGAVFQELAVHDYPVLIAERKILRIE